MKSGDLFQDAADHLIAGVDEVGRGPLAGDVVAAAVILKDPPPEGVTDSKALSAVVAKRWPKRFARRRSVGVGPGDCGRNR